MSNQYSMNVSSGATPLARDGGEKTIFIEDQDITSVIMTKDSNIDNGEITWAECSEHIRQNGFVFEILSDQVEIASRFASKESYLAYDTKEIISVEDLFGSSSETDTESETGSENMSEDVESVQTLGLIEEESPQSDQEQEQKRLTLDEATKLVDESFARYHKDRLNSLPWAHLLNIDRERMIELILEDRLREENFPRIFFHSVIRQFGKSQEHVSEFMDLSFDPLEFFKRERGLISLADMMTILQQDGLIFWSHPKILAKLEETIKSEDPDDLAFAEQILISHSRAAGLFIDNYPWTQRFSEKRRFMMFLTYLQDQANVNSDHADKLSKTLEIVPLLRKSYRLEADSEDETVMSMTDYMVRNGFLSIYACLSLPWWNFDEQVTSTSLKDYFPVVTLHGRFGEQIESLLRQEGNEEVLKEIIQKAVQVARNSFDRSAWNLIESLMDLLHSSDMIYLLCTSRHCPRYMTDCLNRMAEILVSDQRPETKQLIKDQFQKMPSNTRIQLATVFSTEELIQIVPDDQLADYYTKNKEFLQKLIETERLALDINLTTTLLDYTRMQFSLHPTDMNAIIWYFSRPECGVEELCLTPNLERWGHLEDSQVWTWMLIYNWNEMKEQKEKLKQLILMEKPLIQTEFLTFLDAFLENLPDEQTDDGHALVEEILETIAPWFTEEESARIILGTTAFYNAPITYLMYGTDTLNLVEIVMDHSLFDDSKLFLQPSYDQDPISPMIHDILEDSPNIETAIKFIEFLQRRYPEDDPIWSCQNKNGLTLFEYGYQTGLRDWLEEKGLMSLEHLFQSQEDRDPPAFHLGADLFWSLLDEHLLTKEMLQVKNPTSKTLTQHLIASGYAALLERFLDSNLIDIEEFCLIDESSGMTMLQLMIVRNPNMDSNSVALIVRQVPRLVQMHKRPTDGANLMHLVNIHMNNSDNPELATTMLRENQELVYELLLTPDNDEKIPFFGLVKYRFFMTQLLQTIQKEKEMPTVESQFETVLLEENEPYIGDEFGDEPPIFPAVEAAGMVEVPQVVDNVQAAAVPSVEEMEATTVQEPEVEPILSSRQVRPSLAKMICNEVVEDIIQKVEETVEPGFLSRLLKYQTSEGENIFHQYVLMKEGRFATVEMTIFKELIREPLFEISMLTTSYRGIVPLTSISWQSEDIKYLVEHPSFTTDHMENCYGSTKNFLHHSLMSAPQVKEWIFDSSMVTEKAILNHASTENPIIFKHPTLIHNSAVTDKVLSQTNSQGNSFLFYLIDSSNMRQENIKEILYHPKITKKIFHQTSTIGTGTPIRGNVFIAALRHHSLEIYKMVVGHPFFDSELINAPLHQFSGVTSFHVMVSNTASETNRQNLKEILENEALDLTPSFQAPVSPFAWAEKEYFPMLIKSKYFKKEQITDADIYHHHLLHIVSGDSLPEYVKILEEHDLLSEEDLLAKDLDGDHLMIMTSRSPKGIKFLMEHPFGGAKLFKLISGSGYNGFTYSVAHGELESMILSLGYIDEEDLLVVDYQGDSVFHHAARNPRKEFITTLLNCEMYRLEMLHQPNFRGVTPMEELMKHHPSIFAVSYREEDSYRRLPDGRSFLMKLVETNTPLAENLVDQVGLQEADIKFRDHQKRTLAFYAAEHSATVMKAILNHEATDDRTLIGASSDFQTALDLAARYCPGALRAIVDSPFCNATLMSVSLNRRNFLHEAFEFSPESARIILEMPWDFSTQLFNNKSATSSPVTLALAHQPEVIRLLIQSKYWNSLVPYLYVGHDEIQTVIEAAFRCQPLSFLAIVRSPGFDLDRLREVMSSDGREMYHYFLWISRTDDYDQLLKLLDRCAIDNELEPNSNRACIVCQTYRPRMYYSCGHSLCVGCGVSQRNCPQCRQDVTERKLIY